MLDDQADVFAALPYPNADVHALPPTYPTVEIRAVLSMTERLFPGPVDVRHEVDPEIAGHHYMDFNVVAHGSLDEIMTRDVQWHRELLRIAPRSPNIYCLNIDVKG